MITYPTISADQLRTIEIEPREYIIEPWIRAGEIIMIVAPRGVGKTHLAVMMAHLASSGTACIHLRAHRSHQILYLDGEMPIDELAKRFNALNANGNIQIITPDLLIKYKLNLVNLSNKDEREMLINTAQEADLVIIDNLACTYRGRENEADDWRDLQDMLIYLRGSGKTIIIIHHSGKKGQQRGTSAREDIMDTVISMSPIPNHRAEGYAAFKLELTKSRSIVGDAARPVYVTIDSDYQWEYSYIPSGFDNKIEKIKHLLGDGMSVRNIADTLAIPKSTVDRIINQHQLRGSSGQDR